MIGSRKTYNNGQLIGNIVFIKELKKRGAKRIGLFRCECGNNMRSAINDVVSGHTSSCGCKRSKSNTRHGYSVGGIKPEYSIWKNMIRRCQEEKNRAYKNYGARGIRVCDEWMLFDNFIKDMGDRISKNHSLERIDNNGNYEPLNCRWATKKEQCRNKRTNVVVEYNGKSNTLSGWSETTGIPEATLSYRSRNGMPPHLILLKGHIQKELAKSKMK